MIDYDKLGWVLKQFNHVAQFTKYDYDANGNVVAALDKRGYTTHIPMMS